VNHEAVGLLECDGVGSCYAPGVPSASRYPTKELTCRTVELSRHPPPRNETVCAAESDWALG